MGLKPLVELPELLEKASGAPVDVVRKHENLRPSFVRRFMSDIVYA